MKYLILLILFVGNLNLVMGQDDEKAIRGLLQTQTEAWNRGSVDSFMIGYWNHDSLMFIGKSGVTYGWQNTLNNYRKGYPDRAAMGQLHFDLIAVNVLSDSFAQVVGKWNLKRTIGDISGHFTLLLKKMDGKWVIISDHSS